MRYAILLILLLPASAWAIDIDSLNVTGEDLKTGGWAGAYTGLDEDPPPNTGDFMYTSTANDTLIVTFENPVLTNIDSVQVHFYMGMSGNPTRNNRIGWDTSGGTWATSDIAVTNSNQTFILSITGSGIVGGEIDNLRAILVNIDDGAQDWITSWIHAYTFFTEAGAGVYGGTVIITQ